MPLLSHAKIHIKIEYLNIYLIKCLVIRAGSVTDGCSLLNRPDRLKPHKTDKMELSTRVTVSARPNVTFWIGFCGFGRAAGICTPLILSETSVFRLDAVYGGVLT